MLDLTLYSIIILIMIMIIIAIYFKDFYEKLLCINMLSNIGAVAIVTIGSYSYNQSFFDISIIYLLLSYVVNMAILKFTTNSL